MNEYKINLLFIILCSFCAVTSFAAETKKVPQQIAGIALGDNVNDYPDIMQNNSLQEVVITDWHGFRKGIISYGTCKNINHILKMDMKYEDKSEQFHQQLLGKFRQRFGEPDGWHGDSFGVMRIWKWQFIDADKNHISLTLQYNSKNSNETMGNMIRLSYPDKIDEERRCLLKVFRTASDTADAEKLEKQKKSGWSYLIPE